MLVCIYCVCQQIVYIVLYIPFCVYCIYVECQNFLFVPENVLRGVSGFRIYSKHFIRVHVGLRVGCVGWKTCVCIVSHGFIYIYPHTLRKLIV